MNRMCFFMLLALLLSAGTSCRRTPALADGWTALRDSLDAFPATVGVSVLTDSGPVFAYGDTAALPLLSVVKFPLALAVLDRMDRRGTPFDTLFTLTPAELREHTYSPLRDRMPGRRGRVRMDTLLYYAVALSDNNACDVLFGYVGGPSAVERYVHRLGEEDVRIRATEDDMHRDVRRVLDNAASAQAVARLFRAFLRDSLLAAPQAAFLRGVLEQTATGADKLRAGLPPAAVLGHKTGSSDRSPDGVKAADNDAGYFVMPSGHRYYVAVLVHNSRASDARNAALAARVASTVAAAAAAGAP